MNKLSSAAAEMGRKGGKARAANMTPEERSEAARKAIKARWRKYRRKKRGKQMDDGASSKP